MNPHSYRDAVLAAIDAEVEAPGPMPDEMWAEINGDRNATEQAIRIGIRLTKECIRKRVELLPTGPSGEALLAGASAEGPSTPQPVEARPDSGSVGPWKECLYKHPDAPNSDDTKDAERFRYLQNLKPIEAQQFFWNHVSRKQRVKAIDEHMRRGATTRKECECAHEDCVFRHLKDESLRAMCRREN